MATRLSWEQIIRDCYNEANDSINITIIGSAGSLPGTASPLDWPQLIREAYDPITSSLKVTQII